ncbi:unnamed protein product [Chilo suppressalis]|uniref:26S proteasome non-ATPase regulatory subunit 9 n=1 Tax=Chilo suppressalis TaxID=168631 RepID=A0ABN8B230_CHISP|nr:hypothetical protein evm_008420 [Chilo suppressalis]CAH0403067.1 unnamed protein product [Chilo suppressalis]
MDGPARDRVLKLMEEKDRIESDIRDQTAILNTNNVGMTDSLVDNEGFPRGDIDVYKVRHARHRIICLQNDHKAIMKRIEQGLAEVHSDFVGPNGEGPSVVVPLSNGSAYNNSHSSNGQSSEGDIVNLNEAGFASVGSIQPGSPADMDGLCDGDEILQFGSINSRNFTDVTQIHQVVSHSINQSIRVQLRRDHRIITINLTPRPWAQPGLLGCHIRRLTS